MRKFLLLTALSLCVNAPTYADTTFSLINNVFTNGAAANGSVRIDTTTGIVNAINVTVLSTGTNYIFAGTPTAQGTFNNATQYFAQSTDNINDVLVIDIPGSTLIGYSGGNLCSLANLCGDGYAGYFGISTGPGVGNAYTLATGSLAVAATPEPSSLVLLGTGLLGAVGAARRRLMQKA